VAESGEAWEVRCSSATSSVAVMGVGMSRLGLSTSVLEGFVGVSTAALGRDWSGESWGGGVGCCAGTSGADSTVPASVACDGWRIGSGS
jgi:hypothetical protein